MNKAKNKELFVRGALPANLISEILKEHQSDSQTGAYSIFIGQVRGDETSGSRVVAVDFTNHAKISETKYAEIRNSLFEKYHITDLMAYHSEGKVTVGEICFLVLAASAHRREAILACNEAVERIKSELPIWGKLLLGDDGVKWKENS